AGLVPIIEPEVSISSPHKEQAETLLHDAIAKHVEALPEDATIMLKVTIPTQVGLYGDLAADPRVLRVVALSGGYSRDEACTLLARDPTLIASFSRALLEGLTEGQTDEQFNAQPDAPRWPCRTRFPAGRRAPCRAAWRCGRRRRPAGRGSRRPRRAAARASQTSGPAARPRRRR